jgi:hypothetical protein
MFRFSTRSLLWLTVVVGPGVAIFLTLPCKHGRGEEVATRESFEHHAKQWESWCEKNRFNSNFKDFSNHESVRALREMGKGIIPLIFERWKQLPDDSPNPPQPPWWIVLEHLTGKKLVSDEEKLAGLPPDIRAIVKPNDMDLPSLQEKRWREWWDRDGKKLFPKQMVLAVAVEPKDKRDAFMRKMMPQVGKVVTVAGKLQMYKLSEAVETDDGGVVHVMSLTPKAIGKSNDLHALLGKRVSVTGKLQYREQGPFRGPLVARMPEHFYIDITDAIIRTAGEER